MEPKDHRRTAPGDGSETATETELHRSDVLFREAFDSAPIGRVLARPDGRLDRVNNALCEMLGYSREELEGENFAAITAPDDVEESRERVRCLLAGEQKSCRFEKRYLHRDGHAVWTEVITTLLRDERGEPLHFITDIVDITAQKRAEAAVRDHERELALTLEATTDGIWKWDFRTGELFFSHRYYVMLGYEPDEFPASFEAWRDLLHPDDRDPAIAVAEAYLAAKPDTYENRFRLRTKNGEYRFMEAHARVVERDAQGNAVRMIGHHADITERKQREAALRRFEWLNDKEQLEPDTAADAYTPPYEDVTALNTCRVIADAVDKEVLADMGRDLMDLLDTSVAVYEKNGDYAFGVFESAWCRLLDRASFAQCKTDDTKEALRSGSWLCHNNCWNDSALVAIRSGAPTDIECVGGIRLYAVPIRAGGKIVGAVKIGYGTPPGDEPSLRALAERFALPLDAVQDAARDYKPRPRYVIDVAKRRCRTVARMIGEAVQKSRLEAQLAQADRLSSMGTLAAGVAHEINNPLAYTLYNLETVVADLPNIFSEYRSMVVSLNATPDMGNDKRVLTSGASQLEDLLACAREALDGAERIRSIARTLGTFARVDDAEEAPIDIRHAAEHARNMARNETKYRAQLLLDLSPTPPVVGSEGKLAQVFLNLLINAAHAIDEGDVDGNYIRIRTYADGNAVVAEVSDTGKGIPREDLKRLFDPFFTTKPVGEGSGLGLAISKKIIADMGGDITCESREGRGTTFRIRLPAFCEDANRRQETTTPANPSVPRTGGRVLVVDDEPGIRELLCHMLGRDNHEVTTAASGAEGKAILELDQAFDLIVLDLMMPQVSGMDLHRWLADTYPELADRVIFVTGGVFTPGARDYLAKVDNMRFEKPLDTSTFRKIVRKRIAGRGSAPPPSEQ